MVLSKVSINELKNRKKLSKLHDNDEPNERDVMDQINNIGALPDYDIDNNLELEHLSESLRELFKKSKSKLLLEYVTRKAKHTKKFTSLYYKIKSELQLMMNSERLILYNFLLLSYDFRG